MDHISTFIEKFWINNDIPNKVIQLGLRVVLAFLIFLVGGKLIRFVQKLLKKSMQKANAEIGVTQFVDSFVKAALYVLLIFFIASFLGVDAASIVALLGSAGVAIGLAVQGSLSNLAGGVLILLLKPFKVGDYIIENVNKQEGVVAEIQIFYTKLLTTDNNVVILPNGSLANNSIVNVTASECRRLDIKIGISYSADLKKAKKILKHTLEQDKKIRADKEMLVFVDNLADSSVVLGIRCWLDNDEYWPGKWRILESCKYALDAAGIEIPFPQLDVHLQK